MLETGQSPLIAVVEDDCLIIEGEPIEGHPYTRCLRSRLAYYPVGTNTGTIESYMDTQDSAYCSAYRGNPSFTFRNETGHHSFKIISAEGWGVSEREPEKMRKTLEALTASVEAEASEDGNPWKWANTVAGLAGRVCRKYSTELKQLPPRWRRLAHSAIHQGPSTCIRGGSPFAVSWDRKEAFLRALFEPVPLRESWTVLQPGAKPYRYLNKPGIIRATVRIDPDKYVGRLPPLPVRHVGTTVYPAGIVRGVWVTSLLKDAVDRGNVEVIEVHEAIACVTEPIHAWAGERISAVADKRLRKLLYTRYWGRLAATGGWKGTVEKPRDIDPRLIHRFPGSMLYWVWDGYNVDSFDCSPDYRPDHAAFIATINHRRMNEVLDTVPANSLIGTHVDALWCDSDEWKPNGSDFAIKGKGPLRFYGIGTYAHGDKLAAQGYDGPPLTRDSLDEWGKNIEGTNRQIRRWRAPDWARPSIGEDGEPYYGEEWETDPAINEYVESDPPLHVYEDEAQLTDDSGIITLIPRKWNATLATVYDSKWTPKGWIHREPETETDKPNDSADEDDSEPMKEREPARTTREIEPLPPVQPATFQLQLIPGTKHA